MKETYLIVAIFIFSVEAFFYLRKLITSIYPRRPSLVTENEDRINFVIYFIFVVFGLFAIYAG